MKQVCSVSLIALSSLLIGCSQRLSTETPLQPAVPSSSSEASIDFTNEATPKTTDSLEVVHTRIVPTPIRVTKQNSIVLGDAGSGTVKANNPPTLTIVMDYACEFCREEALTLRPWILSDYVSPHRLNVEIVFSPQTPLGLLYAKAALCSAESNTFTAMDAYLLLHPSADTLTLAKEAQKLGIKASTWKYCMETTTFPSAPQAPDGSTIERLPAFILGNDFWIGVETTKVVREKIEKYVR